MEVDKQKYTRLTPRLLGDALCRACSQGDLRLVRYLLTSPSIKKKPDINFSYLVEEDDDDDDIAFCPGHDLFALGQPNSPLAYACASSHLDIAQYLLSSPELVAGGFELADIHVDNDMALRVACQKGDVDMVRFLLASPLLAEPAYLHAFNDAPFYEALHEKQYEVLEILIFEFGLQKTQGVKQRIRQARGLYDEAELASLFDKASSTSMMIQQINSPSLVVPDNHEEYLSMDNDRLHSAFYNATYQGDLEMVRYLLTHPDLYPHLNINDVGMQGAISQGHLDVVRFLLTSPEIVMAGGELADIHSGEETALACALYNAQIEVARYLLTSPELKEHAYLHGHNEKPFRTAMESEHMQSLHFLRDEMKLRNAGAIKKELSELDKDDRKHFEHFFSLATLNEKLNIQLTKPSPGKKPKL